MERLIIVNGVAKSGKGLFCEYLADQYDYFETLSTIDWVKMYCYENYGIDPEDKSDDNRRVWHSVKMMYKDYIFDLMCEYLDSISCTVSLDVREPEEIQRYKDRYKDKCVTIIIYRDDIEAPDNPADLNVYEYEYDYSLNNSGTEKQLYALAVAFKNSLDNLKD